MAELNRGRNMRQGLGDFGLASLCLVVGLPYVGLGIAVEISKFARVKTSRFIAGVYNHARGPRTNTRYFPAEVAKSGDPYGPYDSLLVPGYIEKIHDCDNRSA